MVVSILENPADGFLGKKYKWERIQTVENFIATEDLTTEAKNKLDGAQWVLRFEETEYKRAFSGMLDTNVETYTKISDVTVLRLKFKTKGIVYNLGAVSDKVTEGENPDNNNTDEKANLWEWLERITGIPQWFWKLLAVLIPLAILLPVLSILFPVFGQVLLTILKIIGHGLLYLLKGVLWLLCLPFKGIAALVRKIKEKRETGR